MASERVGDMTVEELKALVQETVVEHLRIMGFVREGEEELWTKPIEQLKWQRIDNPRAQTAGTTVTDHRFLERSHIRGG